MSKSIVFKNDKYLDSSSITHNRLKLSIYLENLKPMILYEDENGSSGNITLSDSSANYKYIEIFYYDTNNSPYKYYTKVFNPNNNKVKLTSVIGANNYFSNDISINNNLITREKYYYNWNNQTVSYENGAGTFKITRVLGYK